MRFTVCWMSSSACIQTWLFHQSSLFIMAMGLMDRGPCNVARRLNRCPQISEHTAIICSHNPTTAREVEAITITITACLLVFQNHVCVVCQKSHLLSFLPKLIDLRIDSQSIPHHQMQGNPSLIYTHITTILKCSLHSLQPSQ